MLLEPERVENSIGAGRLLKTSIVEACVRLNRESSRDKKLVTKYYKIDRVCEGQNISLFQREKLKDLNRFERQV